MIALWLIENFIDLRGRHNLGYRHHVTGVSCKTDTKALILSPSPLICAFDGHVRIFTADYEQQGREMLTLSLSERQTWRRGTTSDGRTKSDHRRSVTPKSTGAKPGWNETTKETSTSPASRQMNVSGEMDQRHFLEELWDKLTSRSNTECLLCGKIPCLQWTLRRQFVRLKFRLETLLRLYKNT